MSCNSVKRCACFCDGGTVKQEDEEAGAKQTAVTLRRVIFIFFHPRGNREGQETAFRGGLTGRESDGSQEARGVGGGQVLLRAAGNSCVFPRAPQHRGHLGCPQGRWNS